MASCASEGAEGAGDIGVCGVNALPDGDVVRSRLVVSMASRASSDGAGELAAGDGVADVADDEVLLVRVVSLAASMGGEGVRDDEVVVAGVLSVGVLVERSGNEVVLVGLLASGSGVVVAAAGEGRRDASADSAASRCGGRSRPRRRARRKIPAAAAVLKKNLGAQSATSTSASEDEHAAPSLGNSEVSAVQHSPGPVVKPELGQRRENDGEISSVVAGKKSGNVLDEDESAGANKPICESGKFKEEAAAGAGEAASATGDAEVLAWEPSADHVDPLADVAGLELCDIGEDSGVREAVGEHPSPEGLDFALRDDAEARPLEAEVEAADA